MGMVASEYVWSPTRFLKQKDITDVEKFQETAQRMITIRDFRPFEVDWLIVYIYGGCPMREFISSRLCTS